MMQKVKSSSIDKIGHDGKNLHVHFANGSQYLYPSVPQKEYQDLLTAHSTGTHFAENIRPHYIGRKVK